MKRFRANEREGIMIRKLYGLSLILLVILFGSGCQKAPMPEEAERESQQTSVLAPEAVMEKLAGGFQFTEGPTLSKNGDIYFSDIPNNRIHIWTNGELRVFRENSGGANGLYFDSNGNLIVCEGGNRRLTSIDLEGRESVLTADFDGKKFNSPNDLWIDPQGGIYFSDPRYGNRDGMEQDGEHVYYLSTDRQKLILVINDMERPNGLIGTPDGKTLYVADHGAGKTYSYRIETNGSLTAKTEFAQQGSDGITIDTESNIYLTSDVITVYNARGEKITSITVPERPANVCFGGSDKKTLFITARTSLYSIRMRTQGI